MVKKARWWVLILAVVLALAAVGAPRWADLAREPREARWAEWAREVAQTLARALGREDRTWSDERIYFILIDRFRNGNPENDHDVNPADPWGWHGGDIDGIIEKLDYIRDLGFTAIWITPHVQNAGKDYHGYGAVDFFTTDPHFGTNETVKRLVREAHRRRIKVLFDIVVNHTGPQHPLVQEHPDWFHPRRPIRNWGDPVEVQEGWLFDLPDFDQSKPEVREYILSYSRFWLEETGVDGFRLDTVKHVPPEFWTWYIGELQKVKPDFWAIGEVWSEAPWELAIYQEAGVPAVLNFPVSLAARKVFAADGSMEQLAGTIASVMAQLPDPQQTGAFIDNHDMERFVTLAEWDRPLERLRLALTFLFTQPSIPIVYYGTEIAMPGGPDPYNRDDFPWGEEERSELVPFIRDLNALRERHPALRRGTFQDLLVDRWHYAYGRVHEGDVAVVVLNNHGQEAFSEPVPVTDLGLADGTVLEDWLSGQRVTVTGGVIRPEVPPKAGAVFVRPGRR